jgi:hypothetical protein
MLGCGVMVWGLTGLLVTNVVENEFGLTPTTEDQEKLKNVLPKIRAVDRNSGEITQSTGREKRE